MAKTQSSGKCSSCGREPWACPCCPVCKHTVKYCTCKEAAKFFGYPTIKTLEKE